MVGFARAEQRRKLKAEMKELLQEMGISKKVFQGKMPRIHGKGRVFEIDEKRQGRKMSLMQRVIWLRELAEATKELREELLQQGEKDEGEITPTFAVAD